MQQNVEDRIRHRAFLIWLEQGQPDGRDQDHWMQAESEVLAEGGAAPTDGGAAVDKPKRAPARRTRKTATPAAGDEESAEAAPRKATRKRTAKPTAETGAAEAEGAAAAEAAEAAPARKTTRTPRRKKTDET